MKLKSSRMLKALLKKLLFVEELCEVETFVRPHLRSLNSILLVHQCCSIGVGAGHWLATLRQSSVWVFKVGSKPVCAVYDPISGYS